MKLTLKIFLILILLSCSGKKKENIVTQEINTTIKGKNQVENKIVDLNKENKKITPEKVIDSLQYFLNLTNGFNKIPEKFYKKYLNIEKPKYDPYFEIYGSLENRPKSLQNYYVVYFSISQGGVCSYDQVATIRKNGEFIDMMEIGGNCDQDQSIPSYKSTSYKIIDSVTIKMTESLSEPKDKSVLDDQRFLLDSLDIDDIEMEVTESSHYVKIMLSGEIEKNKNL